MRKDKPHLRRETERPIEENDDVKMNFRVPHLEITIGESDNNECILKTVQQVRPDWNLAKIELKFLTDGITNKLILCSNAGDDGNEENLLVRIYGHKTDLLIDRMAEIRNIELLHTCSLAPSLYATFNNGLIYEYIPGNTLTLDDVTNPEIYRLIAIEMARMHKVAVPTEGKKTATLWHKLQQFVDLIPDEFDDESKQTSYAALGFTKQQLLNEIRQVKEAVSEFDMPVVFAHNDLLLGNIIYNKKRNKVYFIDFEYASLNYQPYDISNHFTEFAGVNDVDYSRCPGKEFQLDWLQTYLQEYKGVSEVNKWEIEILYVQVNKCVLAAHLFWYAWSLIQAAHSHINFDFIHYASKRLKEYLKRKPEFLALIPPKPDE